MRLVYKNFLKDMYAELQKCVDTAKAAGIEDDRIMLDPGVGFGKTYEMNLDVMKHLDLFNGLGYPMLLGTSRKSMIGLTLDLPVTEREEGTLVTTVMAVQSHYGFVRVHDAEKNRRAIKMTESDFGKREAGEKMDQIKIENLEIFANHGGVSGRKQTGTEVSGFLHFICGYTQGGKNG